MSDLDNALSEATRARALRRSGEELVLPYADALQAIMLASQLQIAILGLEAFEVHDDGLLTVDLSDASASAWTGDWPG